MKITFNEEESLINNFINITEFKCKKCASRARIKRNRDSFIVQCSWRYCKATFSLWKDTIFENSNIKPAKILAICNLWLKNYKTKQISELVGVQRKSIRDILKKIYARVKLSYYDQTVQIGGPGVVVEVDESKFGKRKYHRGHHVEGVWVLGMVERSTLRRVILVPIEKRNSVNLTSLLRKHIHPQSIIYSDCWKGYSNLHRYFSEHKTVNHSVSFVNPQTGTHTNTIEGTWNGLKQTILHRYRTKELILPYLIRFMFIRNENNDHFNKLIKYLF